MYIPRLKPEHVPDTIADLLLVVGTALAPHLCSLNIGGTLVVGFGEHAHDGDENLLDRLDWGPALGGVLVVVRIIAGGMEDGNTDEAAGVDYMDLWAISSWGLEC